MPLQYNTEGKLVIINIQETPLDKHATLKINGFCDIIFEKLMRELQFKIMPYRVERYLTISFEREYDGWKIDLKSIDEHHFKFSFIKNVRLIDEK
jgi:hypothetical protein